MTEPRPSASQRPPDSEGRIEDKGPPMTRMKSILAAVALAVSLSAVAAPVAVAQAAVVITIDEGRILRDSRAGKDIQAKLKNIETQINGELEPTRKTLDTEGKALQTKLQGKTREAIAADAALVAQLQAYQKKANEFGQKTQVVSQEFGLTEQKALIDFNKALEPVLLEVVKEKNAQLVVSKSQVVFSADSIDATGLIISKLDARTPTINVTRQRAPAQPQ